MTRFFALVLVLASACSCADSIEPIPVIGVKATPQSIQIAVGDTQTVVSTISPDNATDRVVHWESTDSTIASVSATGLVTAKKVGSGVFITVFTHDGNHQASANITVNP